MPQRPTVAGTAVAVSHREDAVAALGASAAWRLTNLQEHHPMATSTNSDMISTLNSLLRGELAATETYQQALARAGSEPGADALRQIHAEHREAANTLRQTVHNHGGKPDQDSGAWGTLAKSLTRAAKLLGNSATIKALKEGEEQGIKSYEEALKDATLPADCQELIRGTLLPQTRSHIPVLDRMLQA
jgi:uncharacterized protein (TIGR02284 family)